MFPVGNLRRALLALAAASCGSGDPAVDMGHACTPAAPCVPYDHWRLPDGVPNPKDLPGSLCDYFCEWLSEATDGCTGSLAPDSCRATCQQMLADGRTNNVGCFVTRCSSVCLRPGAIPTPPECDQACMHAGDCKQLYLLGLPDDPDA